MNRSLKIFFTLCFVIFSGIVYAQFSFLNEPYNELEVNFIREKIEATPEQSFFNLIKVKNPTQQALNFQLNLNIPQGWSLFNNPTQAYALKPNDSIMIPFRASIAKDVKGEIGYVLVASLSDTKGKLVKTGYSYVNVPKQSNLQFRPLVRTAYFDQRSKKTRMKFAFYNKGNVDEQIFVNFKLNKNLEVENVTNQVFTEDIFLPAKKDTIIEYDVQLTDKVEYGKLMHRINFEATTRDTAYRTTFWFKDVQSSFENIIPPNNKMLVVDLLASNLFSEYPVIFSQAFFGRVQFKQGTDLYYSYLNFDSKNNRDLYENSQMFVGCMYKGFDIKAGDILSSIENSMTGRGIDFNGNFRNFESRAIFSKDKYADIDKYGGLVSYKLNSGLKFTAGYSANADHTQNNDIYAVFGGISFKFLGNQQGSVSGGYSSNKMNQSGKELTGQSLNLSFGGRVKQVFYLLNSRLSTPDYSGINRGRNEINFMVSDQLNANTFLNFNSKYYYYAPRIYAGDTLLSNDFSTNWLTECKVNQVISSTLTYYIGPSHEYQATNSGAIFSGDDFISTQSIKATGGVKISIPSADVSLSPSFKGGITYIDQFSKIIYGEFNATPKPAPFFTGSFSLNIRAKDMGVFAGYFHGPISISQTINYVYNGKFSKSLRIMPYFEKFVYKDILRYAIRFNYVNNIELNNSRYNLINELTAFMRYGFTLRFLNTFALQKSVDITTDQTEQFTNTYFEIGLRKEFGFNQPRLKFHDLNIIFFKDYNGNNIQDENEPGVKNVLVQITRDDIADIDNRDYVYSGEFMQNELLSDNFGKIRYFNIPEGSYFVKFEVMGGLEGNFTPASNNQQIVMNKNRIIFIPFFENNKIYGHIVLNRSKLSNLGKLDISNIKITATDEKGQEVSTLSDKEGKFVLYVPSVDKYIVHINNIFYENFDLQQNDFAVQLNGYRQFEVNFIFNEKSRRINFSNSLDYDNVLSQQDVRIMRRTTIKGSVKDANTLKPLRAKINVVDNNSQKVIATANSNLRTGEFDLSFLAGDNYSFLVTADDYWLYTENLAIDQLTTFQMLNREVMLRMIEIGSRLQLNNVKFERNKAELGPEAIAELENLVKILKNNPNVNIQVAGFCDDVEILSNANIANERAKVVSTYLAEKGIVNMTYKGFGNSSPVAEGVNEESHGKNRRVEILVVDK